MNDEDLRASATNNSTPSRRILTVNNPEKIVVPVLVIACLFMLSMCKLDGKHGQNCQNACEPGVVKHSDVMQCICK